MDRLISLEPSNLVAIRIEPGQKSYGELTLRNVMYTMPVAFRLQPINTTRYTVKPQSGIIAPLATIKLQITYHFFTSSSSSGGGSNYNNLPDSFPRCDDSFLLHSVVVPGAVIKEKSSSFDAIPNDWFTTRKKQVFIDSGIKIMFVGSPVLVQLVIDGSMDSIREVLERSDQSWKAVDSLDSEGRTLLHIAIAQSRADIVQLLLEFQPDVEYQSRSGSTPLEAAAESGEALIVELLLARKARTERTESSTWGPIHFAAAGGHLDVLRLLLLKGANVDSLTKDGKTALHLSVKECRKDCARLLLTNGANPDIRNYSDAGDTPLHVAAGLGDEHMVKYLLQKGANKDIRNKAGKTAYDLAAEYGHVRLFDVLKLADSLCVAARKGDMRTIQRLIENGVAINGRDQRGWTALHRASFKGRLDVARMLIENGIDLDAKDEDGYTALHCAVESGQTDVVELLVKRGLDIEARTSKGVTATQIAESLHYTGITRVLINSGATRDNYNVDKNNNRKQAKKDVESKDVTNLMKKRRSSRARGVRRSFDRLVPLPVL